MEINIKSIPQRHQRYKTVGDYWTDKDNIIQIRVTKMSEDAMFLVALHELIEFYLVKKRNISEQLITKFDIEFEKFNTEQKEPGDYFLAPYQNEHCIATGVERIMCAILGLKWEEYENEQLLKYSHS